VNSPLCMRSSGSKNLLYRFVYSDSIDDVPCIKTPVCYWLTTFSTSVILFDQHIRKDRGRYKLYPPFGKFMLPGFVFFYKLIVAFSTFIENLPLRTHHRVSPYVMIKSPSGKAYLAFQAEGPI